MSTHRRQTAGSRCALVAASCLALAGQAMGSNDIKTEIDAQRPEAYWPLEYTFTTVLDTQSGLTFGAMEKNGPTQDMAEFEADQFVSVPYLPILPDHVACAPGTTALVFSEDIGDPDGIDRLLFFDYTGSSGAMLDALGMNSSWSMHLIVYPDVDTDDERGEETILDLRSGIDVLEIVVDVDGTDAEYTARLQDGTTMSVTKTLGLSGDPGHQIILTFTDGTPNNTLSMTVDGSTASTDTGTESLDGGTFEKITLGNNKGKTEPFHGAIHHLAVWSRVLTTTNRSDLHDAHEEPEATIADLTVGWSDDPHYFVWTEPKSSTSPATNLAAPNRDLTHWGDPLWDRAGVYPMVRVFIDNGTTFADPVKLGEETADQIQYLETNLNHINMNKSLEDGVGYSIFWQNWGRADGGIGYGTGGDVRYELFRDWRDAPYAWRQNRKLISSNPNVYNWLHPVLYQVDNEVTAPFYREGMSRNAFITAEALATLNDELATITSEGVSGIAPPTRLHFDHEANFQTSKAVQGDTVSQVRDGWWFGAQDDDRANLAKFWASDSDTLGDVDTSMAGLSVAIDELKNWTDLTNRDFITSFGDFGGNNTDHAFGVALLTPARDILNSTIRMSNYKRVAAGDFVAVDSNGDWDYAQYDPAELKDNPLGHSKYWTTKHSYTPDNFDFSAPVLYPQENDWITTFLEFERWWEIMGLSYSIGSSGFGELDSAVIEEDFDNMYVEIRKHGINASYLATRSGGTSANVVPLAPWIPIPGNTWNTDNGKFTNYTGNYTSEWQEIARLAVFAHRRGAREFMIWSGDSKASDNQNILDLEKVLDAVDDVAADWKDFTHSNQVTRADAEFGVPDGTLDVHDLKYFCDRFDEKDIEADVTGTDGHPDGEINDLDYWEYRDAAGCTADFDCDGDVDLTDNGTFGAAFGSTSVDANYDFRCDFDKDGDVDLTDFGIFGTQFGNTIGDCH